MIYLRVKSATHHYTPGYSTEPVMQQFTGAADFGRRVTIDLTGCFHPDLYLWVELPGVRAVTGG